MKNHILSIIFACVSLSMLGQVHEIGGFIGGTNYAGDIGRTNYIYPNTLGGAVIYKWNWNPRIAFRATYSYLPITGDDKNADTDLKRIEGYVFQIQYTNWL